jgi:uncharacterized protein, YfiH family
MSEPLLVSPQAYFEPVWPCPPRVRALISTRSGGVSEGFCASNNLALHVDDSPDHVAINRARLSAKISAKPYWLNQVHSTQVVDVDTLGNTAGGIAVTADAAFTRSAGRACVVMTADCLPLLICSQEGDEVAAVHAGWRGLADGIVTATLSKFRAKNSDLMVFLGPAIGPQRFEVGEDVHDAFRAAAIARRYSEPPEQSFVPATQGKYFANIYSLASAELRGAGVEQIYGGGFCTYSDSDRFYSFRRDGQTGRMASLIWLAD